MGHWHEDGLWASRLADARPADQPEVRERKGWARLARLARQRDSEIGSHIGILHAASGASPFAFVTWSRWDMGGGCRVRSERLDVHSRPELSEAQGRAHLASDTHATWIGKWIRHVAWATSDPPPHPRAHVPVANDKRVALASGQVQPESISAAESFPAAVRVEACRPVADREQIRLVSVCRFSDRV